MNDTRQRVAGLVALAGLLLLWAGTPARAGLILTLEQDGFAAKEITDNGDGDLDGTTGSIIFSQAYGNFMVAIDTAFSNRTTGGASGQLLSNTMSITSLVPSGSATLKYTVSDSGFTFPLGPGEDLLVRSAVSSSNLSAGGVIEFTSFFDNVATPTLTLDGPISTPFGAQNFTKFTRGDTYSLKNVTQVTLGSSGVAQTTGTTEAIAPAPSAFVLALTSLPVFSLFHWLRRRKI